MAFETLETELREGALTVTLSRPERLNAFTQRMQEEILAALDRADEDDDVRAVIFTGAGRAFCAGADLEQGGATFDARKHCAKRSARSEPQASGGCAPDPQAGRRPARSEAKPSVGWAPDPTGAHRDGGGLVALRLFECRKPVIAAVNGPAVGVGATMTLPMDVRLASERARFGFVFSRRGLVPEACSSWFLPRVVGIARAMEWVATGRVFGAEEARAGGLVSRVLPEEELLPAARALAAEIAESTSAVSVCLARQMLWRMLGASHPMEAHEVDSRAMHAMGSSPDAYEGVRSFLEKRPARFPMRVSRDLPDFFPWWEERPFRG